MKKMLKPVSCSLVAIFALSIAVTNPKVGPFGVDTVSAATVEAPVVTPPKTTTPTKPTKTTKPTTTTKTTYSTSISGARILKYDSIGDDVKALQSNLNSKGYKLQVDGIFGKLTLAAVKSYQGNNNLVVDGLVGQATRAKLNPVVSSTSILGLGSTGSAVKTLQTNLNSKGYKLAIDGIFGQLTLASVKNYQSKNGLNVDGLVGVKTLAKLNEKVATTPVVKPPVVVVPPVVVQPPVDTVTAASLVSDIATFEKSISSEGKWIITTTGDLTSTKDLVLEGTFKNGKKDASTGADIIQRKIGLYTQDDKKVVTARFTLTAPKLTIKSPEARIQSGTFKGNLYISAANFQLVDAKVDGNVYFTTQEAKDTFKMDNKSSITGSRILIELDAVATATANSSYIRTEADLLRTIGKDGVWIPCLLNDITTTKELVLDGTFKKTGTETIQRKLALYSQAIPEGGTKKVVTRRFTLTAPKLTVNSPEARIQGGIFKGDLYVSAVNFQLVDAKVEGNIYFTTQQAKDSFKMDENSSVTGTQTLKMN